MPKKNFQSKKIIQQEKVKFNDSEDLGELEKFYNGKGFDQPKKMHSRTVIVSMLVAIVFGLVAGVLAVLLFLAGTFSNSKILSWFNIQSFLPASQIVIEQNEETFVEEDKRILEINSSAISVVVGIYKYKEITGDNASDIYKNSSFLGNGLILTSDGWIVTTNDVVKSDGEYALITQNARILKNVEMKTDNNLGLVYLKADSENLPVVNLINYDAVKVGEKVLLAKGIEHVNKELLVSRVGNKDYVLSEKLIRNSEDYYLLTTLMHSLNSDFWGTPVFNLNKDVIGLVTNYNNINYLIPAEYIKKSFNQMLTLGESKVTYLGIDYINIANVVGGSFNQTGAQIEKIYSNSPLINLDVASGDIIIKVEDQTVNGNYNLTNLIQEYRAGDKVSLTILDKDDRTENIIEIELK